MKNKLLFCLFASIVLSNDVIAQGLSQDDDSWIGESFNDLSLKLLVGHQKEYPGQSIVLTAKSMYSILGVLAMHSEGETFEAITDVLGNKNKSEIKRRFEQSNSNTFNGDVDLPLRYYSRIYADDEYKFCPAFKKTFTKYFIGTTGNANFDCPSRAARKINDWVNRQEVYQIGNRDLVSPSIIKKDGGFIIVSTLELSLDYDSGFNPKEVKPMNFNINNDKYIEMLYLYGAGIIMYADLEKYDAQAISISIKENDFTLFIIIPNKIDGLIEMIQKMTSETVVDEIIKEQKAKCVKLYMPLAKTTEQTDLTKILRKIGNLEILFDKNRAEFSGITKNCKPGFINTFVTEVYLVDKMLEDNNYNEMIKPNLAESVCPDSDELLEIKIDRPFMYHILNNLSGVRPIPFLVSGLFHG